MGAVLPSARENHRVSLLGGHAFWIVGSVPHEAWISTAKEWASYEQQLARITDSSRPLSRQRRAAGFGEGLRFTSEGSLTRYVRPLPAHEVLLSPQIHRIN
jgi:hypothetical protein